MRNRRQDQGLVPGLRWAAVGAVVCAAFLMTTVRSVRTAPVRLLQPADTAAMNAPALRAALPAHTRSRLVTVNLSPLPTPGTRARLIEDDVELELFPDVLLNAVFDRFDTIDGSGTWVGHVDGEPLSTVTLAYRDGSLSANINTRGGVFQIHPAPQDTQRGTGTGRLHIVSEVDIQSLPSGPDTPAPATAPDAFGALALPVPDRLGDAGDVIDMMVVYTPKAMARAGGPTGMANLIALNISDTNTAFANSRLNLQARLVHAELVPYVEDPRTAPDPRSDLRNGVGAFSRVRALRDAYGADIVTVIFDSAGYTFCGVSYFTNAASTLGESWGFNAVGGVECPGIYAFTHELGHNLGARHDWYVDSVPTFAHGYVDTTARWRTVMSYSNLCRDLGIMCQILNYFSTPEIEYLPFCSTRGINCDLLRYWFYPGTRIGVPEEGGTSCRFGVIPASPCAADNRRMLHDMALAVANYRQSR